MTMPKPHVNLRIGVVQFAPKVWFDEIGQVQANLAKARHLCRGIQPKSLDLLCLPEMIFTGYVFENAAAITPYLEAPQTGLTSLFCAELAKKLDCYVIAGYPEILSNEERTPLATKISDTMLDKREDPCMVVPEETHAEPVGANSAAIYAPGGTWVGGYRKSHLFMTDKTWCQVGPGFKSFHLPPPLNITMTLGICMDINPQIPEWTVSSGPYELADYCLGQRAHLLLLLNAWLDSGQEPEEDSDWGTLNYWAARLQPLWEKEGTVRDEEVENEEVADGIGTEDGRETVVVICNRSGDENGETFAGSSSVFSMKHGSGRPKLLDTMGRREEGVRIWNIRVELDDDANVQAL